MPRGRPPHQPTDESRAQVAALRSFGVPQPEIASYVGISEDTLVKRYKDQLERGATERNAEVAGFLYHAASGKAIHDGASYSDCIRAAMFWAKTRMQWREKDPETSTDDKPISIEIINPHV